MTRIFLVAICCLGMAGIIGCGSAKKDTEVERLRISGRAQELIQQGKPSQGIPLAQKARDLAESNYGKGSAEAAIETLNLAKCLFAAKQEEEAKTLVEKAESTLRTLKISGPGLLEGIYLAGVVLDEMKEWKKAGACFGEVVAKGQLDSSEQSVWVVKARERLGNLAIIKDNYPEAVGEYEEAYKVARDKAGYSAERRAKVLGKLALANFLAKDYAKALENSSESFKLAGEDPSNPIAKRAGQIEFLAELGLELEKKPDAEVEIQNLHLICQTMEEASLDGQKLPYARQLLEVSSAQKGPQSNMAIFAALEIGESLTCRNELVDARKALKDAEARVDASALSRLARADIYVAVGVMFDSALAPEDAIGVGNKALKLYEEMGEEGRPGVMRASISLGLSYLKVKKFAQAKSVFEKGLSLMEELETGKQSKFDFVHRNMGELFLEMSDYPKALEHFGKALEFAHNGGDTRPFILQIIHEGISKAQEGLDLK